MSEETQGTQGAESIGSMMESLMSQASEPAPQPSEAPAKTAQAEPTPPTQSSTVEDEIEFEGKKYRVDKSPKDLLLEALKAKKGMRKAFSERDAEVKKIKEREQDLTRYEQIQSMFKNKGVEGLFDALAGKDGAYQEYVKGIEDKAIRKYNASADELKIIELEEARERERALREMAERTAKETLENIQRKEQEAQKSVLTNRLQEAFESVSFDGKLGDEAREQKFDRYIWEQARTVLKEYADKKGIGHHEIPTKVIKDTFKGIAEDFSGAFVKQAGETVKTQVQKTSDAATLAAQKHVASEVVKSDNSLGGLADKYKHDFSGFMNAIFGKK